MRNVGVAMAFEEMGNEEGEEAMSLEQICNEERKWHWACSHWRLLSRFRALS